MPRDLSRAIARHLNWLFENYLRARHPAAELGGRDIRIRIRPGQAREPDQAVLLDGADPRRGPEEWLGADLCVEVVSPDDPDRDYEAKRIDYAAAGVSEYWIVDPRPPHAAGRPRPHDPRADVGERRLSGDGVRGGRGRPRGVLLDGFEVDVTACLAGA